MFLAETGIPIRNIDLYSNVLALAEPDPLGVAILITRSLIPFSPLLLDQWMDPSSCAMLLSRIPEKDI